MTQNRPIDKKDAPTRRQPSGQPRTHRAPTRPLAPHRVWQPIAISMCGATGRRVGRAFTLVEMMAATALATVLMVGALSVIGTMKPTRINGHDPTPHFADIVRLLRWDLTNARTVQYENNTLKLEGYGSLDPAGFGWKRYALLPPSHQPITIEYRLWQNRGHSWLVRRQIHPLERSNRNAWTEVVACDVAHFQLQLDEVTDPQRPATKNGLATPVPVPDRVRLLMRSTDGLTQEINQLIVLR